MRVSHILALTAGAILLVLSALVRAGNAAPATDGAVMPPRSAVHAAVR